MTAPERAGIVTHQQAPDAFVGGVRMEKAPPSPEALSELRDGIAKVVAPERAATGGETPLDRVIVLIQQLQRAGARWGAALANGDDVDAIKASEEDDRIAGELFDVAKALADDALAARARVAALSALALRAKAFQQSPSHETTLGVVGDLLTLCDIVRDLAALAPQPGEGVA